VVEVGLQELLPVGFCELFPIGDIPIGAPAQALSGPEGAEGAPSEAPESCSQVAGAILRTLRVARRI
jgi:hypothetical protein